LVLTRHSRNSFDNLGVTRDHFFCYILLTEGFANFPIPLYICCPTVLVTSMESSCGNLGNVFPANIGLLHEWEKWQPRGSTYGNQGIEKRKIKTEGQSCLALGTMQKMVRKWEQSNMSSPSPGGTHCNRYSQLDQPFSRK